MAHRMEALTVVIQSNNSNQAVNMGKYNIKLFLVNVNSQKFNAYTMWSAENHGFHFCI